MKTPRKSLYLFGVLLVAVTALTFYQMMSVNRKPDQEALLSAGIVLLPQSREIPPLALINQDGQQITVNEMRGRWTLVFFGYTFCPDICPATLAELRKLDSQLSARDRQQMRVVMVSVDPKRDTPEQLKKYLAFFSPEFIGLTGDPANIQTLSNTLGIPFIPGDTRTENYTVDHSGNLALIGPDGTLRGFIRAPLNVAKLTEELPRLLLSR
ncbi:SCO family protein [Azomonas macrocytogenes]|uniref:Protein SCO1/2 n=1 Tax=Azomonas macrocytogenes TaxID=69962 RepID=A0A839T4Y0_AZOMA|nr:SCO family protein [Azomonas macrocytogenes]MBB3102975.1 protein SCO1/2 [Azomonas macrocytogenes]